GHHDRVIAHGAVGLDGGEDGLNRVGVLEIDLCVTRRAKLGIIQRAAKKALDRAVIVGSWEERDFFYAENGRKLLRHALEVAQAVGFVLAADDADAEFLEVFSHDAVGKSDQSGRGEQSFLQHEIISYRS